MEAGCVNAVSWHFFCNEYSSSSGVSFAPPAQRKKARCLNVDIISCAMKMLPYSGSWDDRVYEKIKWVYSYEKQFKTWAQWVEIGKHFREQLRISGFGAGTEELIIDRVSPLQMAVSTQQLVCTLLDFVSEEAHKLPVGLKHLQQQRLSKHCLVFSNM